MQVDSYIKRLNDEEC